MPSTNEEFSLPPLNNGLGTLGRYKNFFSFPVAAALGLATISLPMGIVSAVFASTAAPKTAIPMIIASFVTTSFGIYELSAAYNLATDTESTLAEKLVGVMRAVRDFSRSSARVHVTDGTLEEILKNANERTIADNCKITNSGAIKDVFESEISPYRSAAQSFIKSLPNNASAQEIITLANSYYHDDSRATEAAKARMNDEERRDFTENKRFFRENLIVMKYGPLGEINDSKISQAIFLSQVVASIKNPEKFLSREDEVAEKMKAETIEALEKQKLHHELEKHLLRINHKLDGNEGGKLAVCYGYQLVRDGEHKLIGSTEPNHVVQVEENLHQQQLPRIAGEIAGGVTGATAFPLMKTRNLLEI